ncbi:MAG TPA: ATP-binding protein [Puia sp.]|jgi:signal transduction histidine kinase
MNLVFKPGLVIHRKITWLLLFSIITLAIASGLLFSEASKIDSTNYRIYRTYEIVDAIQQMIIDLPESDPGRSLNLLQKLTLENKDQAEHLATLQQYLLQRSSLKDGRSDGMIRSLLDSMLREEKELLAIRRGMNENAYRNAAYGLIIARVLGFLFIVILLMQLNRDISIRKTVQEKLVRAILEAQEARQMQEQFLANMSHEIRTPMNGIKGMTDLLLDTSLTDKQHELTGIIKSSVNNLLVIINDILDFSKIKAGKLDMEQIDFSVKDVLKGTSILFDHRLKKKGLLLQVKVDPDIPDRLSGDPHRLNQVLTNLLGNAIKFTHQGQISIHVRLQQRLDDQVIVAFSISDTGIGIPEESLPHIFDKFSQAAQDISRRYGGTGLGLTICKQLLHLQGGDITATSTPGKGSVFTFHLPYGYGNKAEPERPVAGIIHDYSNLLAGKRFLVAEDNEINQKLIDYVLKKAGGAVEMVSNGAEAIQYLQNDRTFDLIIMDLQMPEMDGYAATQYIRNDLQMQTPIIAMTATAMKGEQLQCLESGMNEYMTKPFDFADLYKRIGGLLNFA